MAIKFYAVKNGRSPGVYHTWDECKKQVIGFSGASYKSFPSIEEAWHFVGGFPQALSSVPNNPQNSVSSSEVIDEAVAYVDGSFNSATNEFSYGAIIFYRGNEYAFSHKYSNDDLASMHNVAGEIKGAEKAMLYAQENNIPFLVIYHDYEGISKWCTGEWQAKKPGTKAYQKLYHDVSSCVKISFVKVKGHSGDKYNDLADSLARSALGI